MPTPSIWAIGVSAPSGISPGLLAEQASTLPGGKTGSPTNFLPTTGQAATGPTKGHWSEILDWKESPAMWVLLALLAIGVLHLKVGAGGKAAAGVTV